MKIGTGSSQERQQVETSLAFEHQDSGHLSHMLTYMLDAPESLPSGSTSADLDFPSSKRNRVITSTFKRN